MNDHPSVHFYCDGKGEHPWTDLGDLTVVYGLLDANVGSVTGERGARLRAESVWLTAPPGGDRRHVTAHIRCRRCVAPRRHVQWANERAKTRVQALSAAGVTSVNLADLPLG